MKMSRTLIIVISSVAAVVFSTFLNIMLIDRSAKISENAQRESDRRQCELYRSMINAYSDPPPESKTGENVAKNWRDQYDILSCATVLTGN